MAYQHQVMSSPYWWTYFWDLNSNQSALMIPKTKLCLKIVYIRVRHASIKYILWVSGISKRGGFGGLLIKTIFRSNFILNNPKNTHYHSEFLEITDFEKLFLYVTGLLSSKNEINFTPKLRFFILKTL